MGMRSRSGAKIAGEMHLKLLGTLEKRGEISAMRLREKWKKEQEERLKRGEQAK